MMVLMLFSSAPALCLLFYHSANLVRRTVAKTLTECYASRTNVLSTCSPCYRGDICDARGGSERHGRGCTSPVTAAKRFIASCPRTIRKQRAASIGRCAHKTSLWSRSEEHTSELQSHSDLVCRLLLEKKKKQLQATGVLALAIHPAQTHDLVDSH